MKFYDNSGKFLYKIDGQLDGPWGLCLQKCGDHYNLLVCNTGNARVDQFTLEGCFTGTTIDKFKILSRITTTPDDLILVSDWKAKQIYILK